MDFDSLLLTQSKAEARSAWFQLPMTLILQNDTGLKGPDDSTISTLLCCGEAISRLQLSGGFIAYVGEGVVRWEVPCLTTSKEMNEKLPCGSPSC